MIHMYVLHRMYCMEYSSIECIYTCRVTIGTLLFPFILKVLDTEGLYKSITQYKTVYKSQLGSVEIDYMDQNTILGGIKVYDAWLGNKHTWKAY